MSKPNPSPAVQRAAAAILQGETVRPVGADFAFEIVAEVERQGGRVFSEHTPPAMFTLSLDDDPGTLNRSSK